jgi:hypothetical protein
MTLTTRITLLPAFLFVVACAYGQEIHYNNAPGTNFAVYET